MNRVPPAPEFNTHCALADVLNRWARKDWLWTHFPAGEKRAPETARRLKRMGLKPGWPDFIFIGPKAELKLLELKRGSNPLTEEQLHFHAAMRARRIDCRVARSFEQAIEILGSWGVVPVTIAEKLGVSVEASL